MKRQSNDLAMQMTERRNRFQSDANTLSLLRGGGVVPERGGGCSARRSGQALRDQGSLRGLVKNIKINTLGGVIGAGQPIMEIVPADGPLAHWWEAYIRPQDVAFIKPGDEALVKLSAYDYALYGGLDGQVSLISPDTLQDNAVPASLKLNPEESFYRVIVRTNDNRLRDKHGQEPAHHPRHDRQRRHQDRREDGVRVPGQAGYASEAGAARTLIAMPAVLAIYPSASRASDRPDRGPAGAAAAFARRPNCRP